MTDSLPQYEGGDVLEIRENKYIVDQVDITKREEVLQYRLKRLDDSSPPITLLPNYQNEMFTVKIFRKAKPEDITLIEE
jgi:hypothetical protein